MWPASPEIRDLVHTYLERHPAEGPWRTCVGAPCDRSAVMTDHQTQPTRQGAHAPAHAVDRA